MDWILLAAGAALGVAGNFAYDAIRALLDQRSNGKLAITGVWGEWTPHGYGRQFSVGEIKYRFWKRRFDFNGTNYYNDGRPFCHWVTTASYIDRKNGEFHYIFANKDLNSPHVSSYGYGVVTLAEISKRVVPTGGFYLYSGPDGARQMTHTMNRVTDSALFRDRTKNVASDLDRFFPVEWKQRSDGALNAG